jgi:lipoprotein-anchoring transpeptidase ErfK/SrfK
MRSKTFIAVLTSLVALLALAGGVVAYDGTRDDAVPKGVTVAGIDIGGLDRAAAISKLDARYVAGLERPIKVHHGTKTFVLGPKEAKIDVDLDAAVAEALATAEQGNLLTRTWRRVTGGEIDKALEPEVSYSKPAVVRLLDKVRRSVARKPVDAKVSLRPSGIDEVPGKTGLEVKASELHRQIRAAIAQPNGERRFVAHTKKIQPKVTTDELADAYDTVLIADRSTFQLKLYKHLELAKTYRIAVGSAGHDTPAGEYKIANKAVNPAWTVPNSDWAGDLAGQVIPGGAPNNPLKARWLGIYDGVGIHGTSDRGSVGSNASHGCLRMLEEDVIDLYPRVPVGAPILIV